MIYILQSSCGHAQSGNLGNRAVMGQRPFLNVVMLRASVVCCLLFTLPDNQLTAEPNQIPPGRLRKVNIAAAKYTLRGPVLNIHTSKYICTY